MAASIRFQCIFFQPQQAKVTKKPPCQSLQQTYTASDETQLPSELLDWHVPLDASASWDFSALPNDPEPPFFPSSTDFDLYSCQDNLPTFPAGFSEGHHIMNSIPTSGPDSTSTDLRSRSSPEDSKSKPGSSTDSSTRVEKRKANTLAARRYRQKRLDRNAELEAELKEARLERDAFKNQVLKLQGETELLKDLLRQKS